VPKLPKPADPEKAKLMKKAKEDELKINAHMWIDDFGKLRDWTDPANPALWNWDGMGDAP
jgi:hypothetical protein